MKYVIKMDYWSKGIGQKGIGQKGIGKITPFK